MTKKTKTIITAVTACMIIAAVLLGLTVRNSMEKGDGFILSAGGKETVIPFEDLSRTTFSGGIVNGKGEVSDHEYRGIELSVLLQENGIVIDENTKITALAEDNYKAEIKGSEVMTEGTVYIAVECDGEMIRGIEGGPGAQLVVYGDPDSKRQVRNLKRASVE